MDLEGQIFTHMPMDAIEVQDEPSELTVDRVHGALERTMARLSEMAGDPQLAYIAPQSFRGAVMQADAAGLTMEAFGQMFDEALRETL